MLRGEVQKREPTLGMKSSLYFANYCADVRWFAQTVFPNAKEPNSVSGENLLRSPIAFSIPTDLSFPKLAASFGNMTTSRATVPKAAVDEDREPVLPKVEVGFSTDRCRVEYPALDPGPHKCHLKRKLCRFVTLAANCRHGSRALRRHIRKPAVFKFGFKESFHLRLWEGKRR